MAVTEVLFDIRPTEAALARAAADWVQTFYPAIRVSADESQVVISSPVHDPAALSRIWQSGLINERLLAHGTAMRAAVLRRLTA